MKTKRTFCLLAALVILVSACQGLPQTGSPTTVNSTTVVSDPAQGLDSLPAYRASLVFSFDGTRDGAASAWSQTYSLVAAKQPDTRLLTYTEKGLEPALPAYAAFQGFQGKAVYYKETADEPCTASNSDESYDPSTLVEPVSRLPLPTALTSAGGEEQVAGVASLPYTFKASDVITDGSPQGSGQVWLAKGGSYIVKYVFELTGGSFGFDAGSSGTYRWEYTLEALDPAAGDLLPADCSPSLPEVPAMQDSVNRLAYPGYLYYETGSTLQQVVDFYTGSLPTAGYARVGTDMVGKQNAALNYSISGQVIRILVSGGTPTRVTILGQSRAEAEATPQPTPDQSAQSTQVYSNPQVRIINSLSLLTGQDPNPSVFDSYHMESHQLSPKWDEQTDSVIVTEDWFVLDAQGKNIHFTDTLKDESGKQTSSEVYLMGDKTYEMQNGVPVEGVTLASLVWTMWPLDPMLLLGVGATQTSPAGTETLEGRSAEVFQINGTTGYDQTGMFTGFGMLVTRLDGKVWIDVQTGALLKAEIHYDADIKDSTGTVRGSRSGLFEMSVSHINAVTVSLP